MWKYFRLAWGEVQTRHKEAFLYWEHCQTGTGLLERRSMSQALLERNLHNALNNMLFWLDIIHPGPWDNPQKPPLLSKGELYLFSNSAAIGILTKGIIFTEIFQERSYWDFVQSFLPALSGAHFLILFFPWPHQTGRNQKLVDANAQLGTYLQNLLVNKIATCM